MKLSSDVIKKLMQKAKDNYFAKASIVFILSSFLLKGFSLITTPIFTRLLSTDQYGEVSTVITYASFLAVFIFLEVGASIATARIHYTQLKLRKYTANILILGFLIAGIEIAIIIPFADQIANTLSITTNLIPSVIIFALGTAANDIIGAYFVASKMPKQKLIYSVVTTALNLILGLCMVIFLAQDRGYSRILSIDISYLAGLLFVVFYFFRGFNKDNIINIKSSWKYALLFGTPLLLHVVSGRVITLSDRIFIINMCSKTDVAIYSVVYSIGHLGNVFAQACNMAWSPWYFDKTKEGKTNLVNKYARIYILGLTMVYVVIILFAHELLAIMGPSEYASGEPVVAIITVAVFFQLLYYFPALYEQYSRNVKWQAACSVFAAVLNLVLNYFFIKAFGMIGASYATAIAYAVLFLMHEFVARRIVKNYNIKFSIYLLPLILIIATYIFAHFTGEYIVLRLMYLTIMLGFMAFALRKPIKNIISGGIDND